MLVSHGWTALSSLWMMAMVIIISILTAGDGGWHCQWWVVDMVRGRLPLTRVMNIAVVVVVTGGGGGWCCE